MRNGANITNGSPVAVIVARGGSKRIPGKNWKLFAGKPMLVWPLLAAQASGLFGRIIVSTDSDEITSLALAYGAEVPFRRPVDLSDDFATTAAVFLHALTFLESEGNLPQFACCIYPTAPFLRPEFLLRGLEEVRDRSAPAAFSVTTFSYPVLRALVVGENGTVSFRWPEYAKTRSQDLPDLYHDAGQFYWVNTQCFIENESLLMTGARPVILPRKYVQDIDTSEDWDMAELMAHTLLTTNKQGLL